MEKTITVLFDGRVLDPEVPLDLKPHTRYRVTISESPQPSGNGDVWALLEQMAGSIEAPPDWAREHDHYLYDTPKRGTPDNS